MNESMLIEILINDVAIGQVLAESHDSPEVQNLLTNWINQQASEVLAGNNTIKIKKVIT